MSLTVFRLADWLWCCCGNCCLVNSFSLPLLIAVELVNDSSVSVTLRQISPVVLRFSISALLEVYIYFVIALLKLCSDIS